MYSRLFKKKQDFDPEMFDIIFRHHVRQCGMTLEEYAVKVSLPLDFIERVAAGTTEPNIIILKDMGTKFTPLKTGYYEDI